MIMLCLCFMLYSNTTKGIIQTDYCLILSCILTKQPSMDSVGTYRMSQLSLEQQQNQIEQQDDAQFFSVAQEYNERKAKMISHRAMEAMNMIHNFNIKNNPKDPKMSELKEEKTRKTRNDKEGREYTCGGCKLSYLSYPALYTHIKTKHGGVAPQGTIRGKNNNNKRRGRPKNLRAQPNLHHRPQPQFTFPKQYCKLVEQITFIDIDDQDKDDNDEQQPIKMQTELFNDQIRQLKNTNSPIITLPIIKVLAIYLYNVNQLAGERRDAMQTVESVSARLIKFINSNYSKILTEYQLSSSFYLRKQIPQNQIYCEYQKCDYIPIFVNYLFKRLDQTSDQMQVDFLSDFCVWLYKRNLTYVQLLPNETVQAGVNNDNNNDQ